MENGKLPPQAIEFEQVVLGAMLLEKDALIEVVDFLKPFYFYKEQHALVFSSILRLYKKNEPIDILTVTQDLKRAGDLDTVGGAFYVSSLTNRIGSSANIAKHALLIVEKYMQREIIRFSTENIKLAYEDSTDVFELQESILKGFTDLIDVGQSKSFDTIETLGDEFISDLIDKKNGTRKPSISNGIKEIDTYGGNNKSDLIVVAGRPGMGKTAYVVKVLRSCAIDNKIPCGIFSLEMTSQQLLLRIASAECGVDSEDLRKGQVTDSEVKLINNRLIEIKKTPLYIDDTGTINIDTLCIKAKKMKRLYGIQQLVIDYLGYIKTKEKFNNKTDSIGSITNRLKALAKELDIPIILLCQLNREADKRPINSRMPILSDLRDSGEIEQDADQVVFLFRPQYYNDCPNDGRGNYFLESENGRTDVTNKAYVSFAKNRHGKLGTEIIGFKKEFTEFYSLTEQKEAFYNAYNESKLEQNNDFLN